MKKTITINYNAIRKIAIISCVVCLAAFILLINIYGETTVFEYSGDFLVSIKFLPKWLSVIVLLLGVIVRIADFVVISCFSPSIKNNFRPYSKKFKAINIAGLVTLPLWFWALVFYGFHFSRSRRLGIPFEQWEELPFVVFLIVIALIICLMIAYLDIIALTIPFNVSDDKIKESFFIKKFSIDVRKIIASVAILIVIAIILFYFLYLKPCFKKLEPFPISQSANGSITYCDFGDATYYFTSEVKLEGTSHYSIENFEYHGDTFLERNPQYYVFDKNYNQRGIEGTLTFVMDGHEYVINLTKKNNIVTYWEDNSYAEMCYESDTCMVMDVELETVVGHSDKIKFEDILYIYDFNTDTIIIRIMYI